MRYFTLDSPTLYRKAVILFIPFFFLSFSSDSAISSVPKKSFLSLIENDNTIALNENTSRSKILWSQQVSTRLKRPLWNIDPYNAGHFLMIPLQGAFSLNDLVQVSEFDSFFDKFSDEYSNDPSKYEMVSDQLSRLHFVYLASEYLALSKKNNKPVNEKLFRLVSYLSIHQWQKPAWQWKNIYNPSGVFDGGMAERLSWKLSTPKFDKKYHKAIIDEDLFLFAIAGNLKYLQLLDSGSDAIFNEILDFSTTVLSTRVKYASESSDRWLFQPGIWSEHPDYAYAAWENNLPNLPSRKTFSDIAGDSSHSHRWPVWLISIGRGFSVQKNISRVNLIAKLRKGLAEQFITKVLTEPSRDIPFYRTTNFMDGRNGVYRYKYHSTTNVDWVGYGPYGLSRTLSLGWWSLLPDSKMKAVHCYLAVNFSNPNTRRNQANFYKLSSGSDFDELINTVACQSNLHLLNF
jgi:hypothetical protein